MEELKLDVTLPDASHWNPHLLQLDKALVTSALTTGAWGLVTGYGEAFGATPAGAHVNPDAAWAASKKAMRRAAVPFMSTFSLFFLTRSFYDQRHASGLFGVSNFVVPFTVAALPAALITYRTKRVPALYGAALVFCTVQHVIDRRSTGYYRAGVPLMKE